jgi:quercetin dioxygenase-like cupin family protein
MFSPWVRFGLLCWAGVAAIALASPCPAGAAESSVVVTPLLSAITTPSGQPIILPQGDARVTVSTYVIAPGARLPIHRHPYPRYAYVEAGTLRVTDTDTTQSWVYKAGDFVVEVVGQWHFGENIGAVPVRLLVIDMMPKVDTHNTVLQSPP